MFSLGQEIRAIDQLKIISLLSKTHSLNNHNNETGY